MEDDVKVSRGDLIVKENDLPIIDQQFSANICWMDSSKFLSGNKYIIQHGINKVIGKVDEFCVQFYQLFR